MYNTLKLLSDSIKSNTNEVSELTAGGAAFMFFIFALVFIFAIAVFVFWLIALIHLVQHEDVKDRTLWLVLLLLVGGLVGPIYYFAVQKPYQKLQSSSKPKSKK